MRYPAPMLMYRSAGPSGALGCGLALLCLGLFLLTPVAVLLLKGMGWTLAALGLLVMALGDGRGGSSAAGGLDRRAGWLPLYV